MVVAKNNSSLSKSPTSSRHPLDPLTFEEINLSSSLVKEQAHLGIELLFETIMLIEPPKSEVITFLPGDPITRDVFVVVLNYKTERLYELEISLDLKKITRCEHIPGVQPAFMFGDINTDFNEWEAHIKGP